MSADRWAPLGELLAVLGRGVLSESDANELFHVLRRTLEVDAVVISQEWGRFGGFLRSDGVPPEWPAAYAKVAHQDPARAFLGARPSGAWFLIRCDSNQEELNSQLYQTFRQMGFHDGAITQLPSSGAPVTLVLYRMQHTPRDFGHDRVLLDILSPHLQYAFGRERSARAWQGNAAQQRQGALATLPHARLRFDTNEVTWSSAARELFERLLGQPFDRARAKLDRMVAHAVGKDVGRPLPIVSGVFGEVLTIRNESGRLVEAVVLFERAALASTTEDALSPAEELLTPKQRLVARLAANGMSIREVAGELELSQETVRTHLKAVYERLGITERSTLTHLLR